MVVESETSSSWKKVHSYVLVCANETLYLLPKAEKYGEAEQNTQNKSEEYSVCITF